MITDIQTATLSKGQELTAFTKMSQFGQELGEAFVKITILDVEDGKVTVVVEQGIKGEYLEQEDESDGRQNPI
jgi:hypothetical protein